ncbi:hypothetical protein AJ79_00537 [Helicocarpus griseus UAMH5409]|uniref:Uncharacterized protein n=1 Tax=Helicocarpus griseus UAMH5409 TaxID=1447875 RepID=A0A2B7YCZ2_9EURO|nr:hypothetical protein AJ79_00537 [Helicocarpus griseus UAMH5409]
MTNEQHEKRHREIAAILAELKSLKSEEPLVRRKSKRTRNVAAGKGNLDTKIGANDAVNELSADETSSGKASRRQHTKHRLFEE